MGDPGCEILDLNRECLGVVAKEERRVCFDTGRICFPS